LFAGPKAAVQFQQLHQVDDRPFPIVILVLLVGAGKVPKPATATVIGEY